MNEDGGDNGGNNDLDLLTMDPNLLTFEQQMRRAELESMREMRQHQMQIENQNHNQNNEGKDKDTKEIVIEGVSQERLKQIVEMNPEDMTEEEILIYTQ